MDGVIFMMRDCKTLVPWIARIMPGDIFPGVKGKVRSQHNQGAGRRTRRELSPPLTGFEGDQQGHSRSKVQLVTGTGNF